MLVDENPYKAALRAGFVLGDLESTDPTVAELMADHNVINALRSAREQRASRVKMTQDSILHEMSLLSHSSLEHYLVDDNGNVQLAEGAPEGAMRALRSIKRRITQRTDLKSNTTTREINVEITLWDKPTPLKTMGKQTGLFPDKVEHTGPNGGPIETITRVERVIVDPVKNDAPI